MWPGCGPNVAAARSAATGRDDVTSVKRVRFAGGSCRSLSSVVSGGVASQAEGRGFEPRRPLAGACKRAVSVLPLARTTGCRCPCEHEELKRDRLSPRHCRRVQLLGIGESLTLPAVFKPDEKGWTMAQLAEWPAVVTCAPTLDEARDMLIDAAREMSGRR